MLKSAFFSFLMALSVLGLSIHRVSAQEAGRLDMLSNWWKFDTTKKPQGLLKKSLQQGVFLTNNPEKGFTIKFNVNLSKFEGEQRLLDIPGVVEVKLRRASPNDRDRQNYPTYKMTDGSLPVLEANVMLYRTEPNSEGKKMEIGVPLAMIKNGYGKHEVILNFDGPRWTMYVDGELVDNEFPIGYPKWESEATWSLNPQYVENAGIFMPCINPVRDTARKPAEKPQVQYWTPAGHNSWVGDVATHYHNGRYHIFYLYDRRHHASKFGAGGHYFEHLSTTDFKTWTEHEAAAPIDEQWETFGTGTPFVYEGKLHISYGLHTSRIYPDEKNMSPALEFT